jgi:hypothetical protein
MNAATQPGFGGQTAEKSINELLAEQNIFTVKSTFYGKKTLYREGEFLGHFSAHEACGLLRELRAA